MCFASIPPLHAGSYLTTIALAVERLNAMRSPGGSPSANPLLHGGCYPMRKERPPISISLLATIFKIIIIDIEAKRLEKLQLDLTLIEKFNSLSPSPIPKFSRKSFPVNYFLIAKLLHPICSRQRNLTNFPTTSYETMKAGISAKKAKSKSSPCF